MKHLKITVNGVLYDVQVEEADAVTPSAAVAPPAPKAAVPSPAENPAVDAESITSPMPGTILDIKVQAGQKVKSGDVLLILEAMKMENEILAPHDAVVDRVLVSKGQSVESGTPLVSLH